MLKKKAASGTMLALLLILVLSELRLVSANVPTVAAPVFQFLNVQTTPSIGNVDMEFTFRNIGFPATTGTVPVPWEKVWYDTPLAGNPPSGNINETRLEIDVNGDDDKLDAFTVRYVNDTQAQVDSTTANARIIPSQMFEYPGGRLDVRENSSFGLGTKTHGLYDVNNTRARFGLASFYRDHPSPNIEVVISQIVMSPRDASTAEVVNLRLNGSPVLNEFNLRLHEFYAGTGQWIADNAYVYPLGFVDSNEVFTVQLSIKGKPGNYVLTVLLNWSPDNLHTYRYVTSFFAAMPFEVPSIMSDVNLDSVVNMSDISLWADAFGSKPEDPNWNSDVDLNLDKIIDIYDGIFMGVDFGRTWMSGRVGLVLSIGGLGDKAFNDLCWSGVKRAEEELGIVFDYVEPTTVSEYEGLQRTFAATGNYDIIICVGWDQADALNVVAAEYPSQKFAIVDNAVNKPNVASLQFKTNEGSFLVGVVAGLKTKTGKVGFVGGMDTPLIRDFFVGYEAGAEWANSTVEVVPPVFVGSFTDPTTGKLLALELADLGADVIYAAAGKSGLGALEAVNERGITGLGVDACQCYLYPGVIASMIKRTDVAAIEVIKATIYETFQGGIYKRGLKEEWVGCCRLPEEEDYWEETFQFTHSFLEKAVIEAIDQARDKIVTGEIIVPSAF